MTPCPNCMFSIARCGNCGLGTEHYSPGPIDFTLSQNTPEPSKVVAANVARQLRELADRWERGEFG